MASDKDASTPLQDLTDFLRHYGLQFPDTSVLLHAYDTPYGAWKFFQSLRKQEKELNFLQALALYVSSRGKEEDIDSDADVANSTMNGLLDAGLVPQLLNIYAKLDQEFASQIHEVSRNQLDFDKAGKIRLFRSLVRRVMIVETLLIIFDFTKGIQSLDDLKLLIRVALANKGSFSTGETDYLKSCLGSGIVVDLLNEQLLALHTLVLMKSLGLSQFLQKEDPLRLLLSLENSDIEESSYFKFHPLIEHGSGPARFDNLMSTLQPLFDFVKVPQESGAELHPFAIIVPCFAVLMELKDKKDRDIHRVLTDLDLPESEVPQELDIQANDALGPETIGKCLPVATFRQYLACAGTSTNFIDDPLTRVSISYCNTKLTEFLQTLSTVIPAPGFTIPSFVTPSAAPPSAPIVYRYLVQEVDAQLSNPVDGTSSHYTYESLASSISTSIPLYDSSSNTDLVEASIRQFAHKNTLPDSFSSTEVYTYKELGYSWLPILSISRQTSFEFLQCVILARMSVAESVLTFVDEAALNQAACPLQYCLDTLHSDLIQYQPVSSPFLFVNNLESEQVAIGEIESFLSLLHYSIGGSEEVSSSVWTDIESGTEQPVYYLLRACAALFPMKSQFITYALASLSNGKRSSTSARNFFSALPTMTYSVVPNCESRSFWSAEELLTVTRSLSGKFVDKVLRNMLDEGTAEYDLGNGNRSLPYSVLSISRTMVTTLANRVTLRAPIVFPSTGETLFLSDNSVGLEIGDKVIWMFPNNGFISILREIQSIPSILGSLTAQFPVLEAALIGKAFSDTDCLNEADIATLRSILSSFGHMCRLFSFLAKSIEAGSGLAYEMSRAIAQQQTRLRSLQGDHVPVIHVCPDTIVESICHVLLASISSLLPLLKLTTMSETTTQFYDATARYQSLTRHQQPKDASKQYLFPLIQESIRATTSHMISALAALVSAHPHTTSAILLQEVSTSDSVIAQHRTRDSIIVSLFNDVLENVDKPIGRFAFSLPLLSIFQALTNNVIASMSYKDVTPLFILFETYKADSVPAPVFRDWLISLSTKSSRNPTRSTSAVLSEEVLHRIISNACVDGSDVQFSHWQNFVSTHLYKRDERHGRQHSLDSAVASFDKEVHRFIEFVVGATPDQARDKIKFLLTVRSVATSAFFAGTSESLVLGASLSLMNRSITLIRTLIESRIPLQDNEIHEIIVGHFPHVSRSMFHAGIYLGEIMGISMLFDENTKRSLLRVVCLVPSLACYTNSDKVKSEKDIPTVDPNASLDLIPDPDRLLLTNLTVNALKLMNLLLQAAPSSTTDALSWQSSRKADMFLAHFTQFCTEAQSSLPVLQSFRPVFAILSLLQYTNDNPYAVAPVRSENTLYEDTKYLLPSTLELPDASCADSYVAVQALRTFLLILRVSHYTRINLDTLKKSGEVASNVPPSKYQFLDILGNRKLIRTILLGEGTPWGKKLPAYFLLETFRAARFSLEGDGIIFRTLCNLTKAKDDTACILSAALEVLDKAAVQDQSEPLGLSYYCSSSTLPSSLLVAEAAALCLAVWKATTNCLIGDEFAMFLGRSQGFWDTLVYLSSPEVATNSLKILFDTPSDVISIQVPDISSLLPSYISSCEFVDEGANVSALSQYTGQSVADFNEFVKTSLCNPGLWPTDRKVLNLFKLQFHCALLYTRGILLDLMACEMQRRGKSLAQEALAKGGDFISTLKDMKNKSRGLFGTVELILALNTSFAHESKDGNLSSFNWSLDLDKSTLDSSLVDVETAYRLIHPSSIQMDGISGAVLANVIRKQTLLAHPMDITSFVAPQQLEQHANKDTFGSNQPTALRVPSPSVSPNSLVDVASVATYYDMAQEWLHMLRYASSFDSSNSPSLLDSIHSGISLFATFPYASSISKMQLFDRASVLWALQLEGSMLSLAKAQYEVIHGITRLMPFIDSICPTIQERKGQELLLLTASTSLEDLASLLEDMEEKYKVFVRRYQASQQVGKVPVVDLSKADPQLDQKFINITNCPLSIIYKSAIKLSESASVCLSRILVKKSNGTSKAEGSMYSEGLNMSKRQVVEGLSRILYFCSKALQHLGVRVHDPSPYQYYSIKLRSLLYAIVSNILSYVGDEPGCFHLGDVSNDLIMSYSGGVEGLLLSFAEDISQSFALVSSLIADYGDVAQTEHACIFGNPKVLTNVVPLLESSASLLSHLARLDVLSNELKWDLMCQPPGWTSKGIVLVDPHSQKVFTYPQWIITLIQNFLRLFDIASRGVYGVLYEHQSKWTQSLESFAQNIASVAESRNQGMFGSAAGEASMTKSLASLSQYVMSPQDLKTFRDLESILATVASSALLVAQSGFDGEGSVALAAFNFQSTLVNSPLFDFIDAMMSVRVAFGAEVYDRVPQGYSSDASIVEPRVKSQSRPSPNVSLMRSMIQIGEKLRAQGHTPLLVLESISSIIGFGKFRGYSLEGDMVSELFSVHGAHKQEETYSRSTLHSVWCNALKTMVLLCGLCTVAPKVSFPDVHDLKLPQDLAMQWYGASKAVIITHWVAMLHTVKIAAVKLVQTSRVLLHTALVASVITLAGCEETTAVASFVSRLFEPAIVDVPQDIHSYPSYCTPYTPSELHFMARSIFDHWVFAEGMKLPKDTFNSPESTCDEHETPSAPLSFPLIASYMLRDFVTLLGPTQIQEEALVPYVAAVPVAEDGGETIPLSASMGASTSGVMDVKKCSIYASTKRRGALYGVYGIGFVPVSHQEMTLLLNQIKKDYPVDFSESNDPSVLAGNKLSEGQYRFLESKYHFEEALHRFKRLAQGSDMSKGLHTVESLRRASYVAKKVYLDGRLTSPTQLDISLLPREFPSSAIVGTVQTNLWDSAIDAALFQGVAALLVVAQNAARTWLFKEHEESLALAAQIEQTRGVPLITRLTTSKVSSAQLAANLSRSLDATTTQVLPSPSAYSPRTSQGRSAEQSSFQLTSTSSFLPSLGMGMSPSVPLGRRNRSESFMSHATVNETVADVGSTHPKVTYMKAFTLASNRVKNMKEAYLRGRESFEGQLTSTPPLFPLARISHASFILPESNLFEKSLFDVPPGLVHLLLLTSAAIGKYLPAVDARISRSPKELNVMLTKSTTSFATESSILGRVLEPHLRRISQTAVLLISQCISAYTRLNISPSEAKKVFISMSRTTGDGGVLAECSDYVAKRIDESLLIAESIESSNKYYRLDINASYDTAGAHRGWRSSETVTGASQLSSSTRRSISNTASILSWFSTDKEGDYFRSMKTDEIWELSNRVAMRSAIRSRIVSQFVCGFDMTVPTKSSPAHQLTAEQKANYAWARTVLSLSAMELLLVAFIGSEDCVSHIFSGTWAQELDATIIQERIA